MISATRDDDKIIARLRKKELHSSAILGRHRGLFGAAADALEQKGLELLNLQRNYRNVIQELNETETNLAELEKQLAKSRQETQAAMEDLEDAEIAIESACTLLTPRPDGTISAESARQILFDYGEPHEAGKGSEK